MIRCKAFRNEENKLVAGTYSSLVGDSSRLAFSVDANNILEIVLGLIVGGKEVARYNTRSTLTS